ncbi:MAG: heme NO-binding domain-containing protein [Pseudomonadota bacterium]
MYGLVNRAVRGMVLRHFDEDTWQQIADAAGVDDDFVDMLAYPDEDTYALVAAASERLGQSPDQILRGFGSHWIQFTADEGYGGLVGMMGSTLEDFLIALGHDLHGRIVTTMPALKPPEFETERLGDKEFRIRYFSERSGLTSMVLGLLEGLALKYDRKADVRLIEERATDLGCEALFEMTLLD